MKPYQRLFESSVTYDRINRADVIFDALVHMNKHGEEDKKYHFVVVFDDKKNYVTHEMYDAEDGEFISSSNEWNSTARGEWMEYDPKRYLKGDVRGELGSLYKYPLIVDEVIVDKYGVMK